MILNVILGSLALLSLALLLWQWLAARRFPLHQRVTDTSFAPAVSLLKPLKGCDAATEDCLRSWFSQDYAGEIQILFAVVSLEDPVCAVVQKLTKEFPQRDAQLIVVSEFVGANAKVSKLVELEKLAKHEIIVVSDADVRVPADFLANVVQPLRKVESKKQKVEIDQGLLTSAATEKEVGLVNCFYRLANPQTLAMQWEAIAINADFWSQVLQSKTLKPLDFALGAVMVTRRRNLEEIGGFKALADCLADDYQLGNRIAKRGHEIVISPVVAECWDPPMDWRAVWKHQLRWARTIRVSQPVPYFFSILSNAGFWALICLAFGALQISGYEIPNDHESAMHGSLYVIRMPDLFLIGGVSILIRIMVAFSLQSRLTQSIKSIFYYWLVPFKDVLQFAIWLGAFAGNNIEWRGQIYRLRPDGTLEKK